MTANVGKGANGKPGERSTGAGAKDGQPRKKKTSAAKPSSDEVTLRTSDETTSGAGPGDTADETAVDDPDSDDTGETTFRDADRSEGESSDGAPEDGQAAAATTWHGETTDASGYGPAPAPDARSYGSIQGAALEPSRPVPRLTGGVRKPEKAAAQKPPRKAHLQVARFEPWSVMKFSFIMSLVCFLVLFVAVAVLYVILSGLGVFDALSNTIRDLTSNDQGKSGGIDPASWFSAARILGYTALIGTLNVLLITALATVWSVIYNMAADLVGGVEVTLKEADQ